MSPLRTCPNGHHYTKTSDCPTYPQCEAARATKEGWMAQLGAPARRALESAGIKTLSRLSRYSEKDLMALHGFGPGSLPAIREALDQVGLQLKSIDPTMPIPVRKPTNTAEYLVNLPNAHRKALETLRKQILAAVPGTVEKFAYGVPAYRYNGHPLVYMGASKNHCGLYGSVPPGFKEALKGFKMGKGSIQFTPEKPIPADVLKALLRSKAAEIEVRWPVKVKKTIAKQSTRKTTATRK